MVKPFLVNNVLPYLSFLRNFGFSLGIERVGQCVRVAHGRTTDLRFIRESILNRNCEPPR